MKVVSVTLSGNNSSIIEDAIKSVVDWVDACIVIDTGITDNTLEVAKKAAEDKFIKKTFPWKNDFAAARNYTLKAALEEGADWAVILDTDERISLNGEEIRKILSTTQDGCLIVNHSNNTYGKVRFIKLPTTTEYVGPTHEVFLSYLVKSSVLEKCKFHELSKTEDQYRHKFNRDVDILKKHTKENPNDPRWFYYLGESYKNLNNQEKAIEAYHKCWELNGWDEESAWSMYRSAECYLSSNNYVKATECLTKGMARHPAIPELSWLAGWCFYKQKIYDKAILWSKISLSLGYAEGIANEIKRIGFKHPPGQWEGPYDVLRWSYKELLEKDKDNLSLKDKADFYEKKFFQALKDRSNQNKE